MLNDLKIYTAALFDAPQCGSHPLASAPQESERASEVGRRPRATSVQRAGTGHLCPSTPTRARSRLGTDGPWSEALFGAVFHFDDAGRVLAALICTPATATVWWKSPPTLGTAWSVSPPVPSHSRASQDPTRPSRTRSSLRAPPEGDPLAPGWVRWFETAKSGDPAPASERPAVTSSALNGFSALRHRNFAFISPPACWGPSPCRCKRGGGLAGVRDDR